jgi:hypothetical protein
MSGAKSYEFLYVERAELSRLAHDETTWRRELREALRLFTEIGAPIHAERSLRNSAWRPPQEVRQTSLRSLK